MTPIQETQELKTPSGEHTLVVRAYMTGADIRSNRRSIMEMREQNVGDLDMLDRTENHILEMLVLEMDGSKEQIVERVLAMRAEDYNFIIDHVNSIVQGVDKKKEETSDGSTKTS